MNDLYEKSNFKGAIALTIDWLTISISIFIATTLDSVLVSLGLIVIIGIKQYALGEVLCHEASHNNLFKTKSYNKNFELLFAIPFFRTVSDYRIEHFPHHKNLGKKEDLLCESYKQYNLDKIPRGKIFFFQWFFKPLLGWGTYYWIVNEFKYINVKENGLSILINIFLIIFSASFGFLKEVLIFWYLPLIWIYPAMHYWQEIEDHYCTSGIARNSMGLLRNSLTHNTGYHYTHHIRPSIPFFNLKKAHEINRSCQDTSSGFFDSFFKILKSKNEKSICFKD